MAAASSHRLTANPVSLSAESCMSHRPRSPLTCRPLVATVALYVFSKSFHEPGRSFPHVIRMIMSVPPAGYSSGVRTLLPPQARVEGVAEAVAEKVQGQASHRQGNARERAHPERLTDH